MIATIKKVKPMFDGLITTMNRYGSEVKARGSNLIDASKANTVKEYQTVVAIGPMVRGIEVGDTVFINPKRYAVMKHKPGSLQDGVIKDNPVIGYNFDIVEIDGVEHLYLQSSDIKFVAEVEEFDPEPPVYIPRQPKIIV